MRQGAGAGYGLRRAAALGAVATRIRPQLERHSDDVITSLERKLSRDRRVDATAHRDQSAPSFTFTRHIRVNVKLAVPCRGTERSMQCVRGQCGRMEGRGRQPSELLV